MFVSFASSTVLEAMLYSLDLVEHVLELLPRAPYYGTDLNKWQWSNEVGSYQFFYCVSKFTPTFLR